MKEMTGEDMAILALFEQRPSRTLKGRVAREARPLRKADRQRISTRIIKDRQLNLQVTSPFYERVTALAHNEGISMAELVERAVEAYAQQFAQKQET